MKRSIGFALAARGEALMECLLSSSGKLGSLVATIRRSPILGARRFSAAEWAKVRHSPEVDAYVLAWIASHKSTAQLAKTCN